MRVVPNLARITVPSLDRRERASLKYRGFICSAWFGNTPAQMIDWMTKNKLNRILIPASQYMAADEWRKLVVHRTIIPRRLVLAVGHHSFDHFLSRAKYFDKHPEWFALVDGKRYRGHRTDGQFCLSNSDAVRTDDQKRKRAQSQALSQKYLSEAKTLADTEHVKRRIEEEQSVFDALQKFNK